MLCLVQMFDCCCCCFLSGCQDNASKLLLALMESRHDSENAERILFNLRPRELVRASLLLSSALASSRFGSLPCSSSSSSSLFPVLRAQVEVIKKAYHQDSEFEGVEVSPREVGHNIYILAQQVSKHKLPIGFLDGRVEAVLSPPLPSTV